MAGLQFRDEMMKPWPSRALYRVSVPKRGVMGISVHGTFHHVETALGVSGATVLDVVESLIRLCSCMYVSSPRKGVVRAVWREKWMIELKREPGAEALALYRLDDATSVWKPVWPVGRVASASADAAGDSLFAVVVADVAYVDLLVWHFFTVLVAVFRTDCCASREECAAHACSKVRCIGGAVKMMPDGVTPVLDARGRPERHVIEKECRPSACCRIPYRVSDGGATVWNPDHYDYVAWIPQYAVGLFDMHGGHAVFRDFFSMCLRALRAGEPLNFYNGFMDARREEPPRAAASAASAVPVVSGGGAGAGGAGALRSRLSGGPAGTKPVPVFMS